MPLSRNVEPAETNEILCDKAHRAANAGEFDQAIAYAAQACVAAPDAPEPAIILATLLRQRLRGTEAAAALRRLLALRPDCVEAWNHLGLALRAANDPMGSLEAFRRAAQLRPDDRWAETNMAFSLLREVGDDTAAFAPLGRPDAPAEIDLGLFCDRFPHTYGFLIQQFSTYLAAFPQSRVYSFGRRVFEPYDPGQFDAARQVYHETHPEVAHRVEPLVPRLETPGQPGDARQAWLTAPGGFRRPRLAHCVFAMNADLFRPLWESLKIPFSFTLNPGGGFRLDDPYSDERLRRVFASPQFRTVIATYPLTRDYIMARFAVPAERIALIPGTIVLESLLERHRHAKRRFGVDKDTLDLCFVGMRYTPTGADKGYDRFIAAGQHLADRFPALRLHVVGDFTPEVIDVTRLAGRITFHGQRNQRWMAAFFSGMDAILSPNVADQISLGAFDGFPVTSCIEAGMCGVAVVSTDPMRLNFALSDGLDVLLLPDRPSPRTIADRLEPYLAEPERLYALAAAGEQTFHRVWGEAAQMTPRLALMRQLLSRIG